jgi:hypothetical protein
MREPQISIRGYDIERLPGEDSPERSRPFIVDLGQSTTVDPDLGCLHEIVADFSTPVCQRR